MANQCPASSPVSLPSWSVHSARWFLCFLGLICFVAGQVTVEKKLKSIKGNVEVDTPYGRVRGVTWYSQYEQLPERLVNVFLGIPYAKTLRQHGSQWREKYRFHIATESSSVASVLYPVIVFLHGGGFIMGASKQWPGNFLAERLTVVVVVNFRQNALGFLSTGDRYSAGNYGMFDQIKAMQFVKKVRGVTWYSQYEQLPERLVNVFLGIPYAKTLRQHGSQWREKYRFHNPDDDPYWSNVYDATKHKPACPQMLWYVKETDASFNQVDEDCLYLDIYAPSIATESSSVASVLYPVIVFLHGGGFIMGASKQWPGNFLAERLTVVVVVNFRQNALGFLSTGDRYSAGNYGMFDQIKAMQFVKKVIRSFRGNPDKITLMGHSSGAAAVGMHLLSSRSVGLFNRAIMLSGSELSEWAVIRRKEAKEYARLLCREVGCPTGDSLQMMDCLRFHRSFEQIVNASAKVPMLPGRIGNPWAPVVDGPIVGANYAFLTDPPQVLRRQVGEKKVSLLVGMVKDEGAFFIPNLPNLIDGVEESQFSNIVDEFIRYRNVQQPIGLKDAMEFQYTYWPQPTNESFIRKKLIEMMGDYMFGAAISETMRQHVQHSAVYSYVFEYSSWRNYVPQWRGVAHGQDLDYIFGFPFINETYRQLLNIYPRQFYDYADRNISEYMITMITNFTNTGSPTPNTERIQYYRNVSWWHYNAENHTYLSINNISRNLAAYRQHDFHFWNDYYPKLAGSSLYDLSESEENPSKASTFKLATWSLVAVCGVLLFTVICLTILLCRRSRTKKYPKYHASATNERDLKEYNSSRDWNEHNRSKDWNEYNRSKDWDEYSRSKDRNEYDRSRDWDEYDRSRERDKYSRSRDLDEYDRSRERDKYSRSTAC
ncbi:neuroligin-4, y-linked [Plakobranchus ocellatus]|uniref:Neuroligin-4, y-linked n=1 Tax=Plakobranchus ocellatus TaxID=259542 RepID=A0AAV4ATN0_9GAST|nr:neuroligin-4, y-linked [Plakobranchus ocellatus]